MIVSVHMHKVAGENIRFSSLFAAEDVCETSPAAKSEEKRMFSQANAQIRLRGQVMYRFHKLHPVCSLVHFLSLY